MADIPRDDEFLRGPRNYRLVRRITHDLKIAYIKMTPLLCKRRMRYRNYWEFKSVLGATVANVGVPKFLTGSEGPGGRCLSADSMELSVEDLTGEVSRPDSCLIKCLQLIPGESPCSIPEYYSQFDLMFGSIWVTPQKGAIDMS